MSPRTSEMGQDEAATTMLSHPLPLPHPRTFPRGFRMIYRAMIWALLHRLRVLTPAQAGDMWWEGTSKDGDDAVRRLNILIKSGSCAPSRRRCPWSFSPFMPSASRIVAQK